MRMIYFSLFLLMTAVAACTPDASITVSESDVVVTVFDETFNFTANKTYAMPDTIVHVTGDSTETDDPALSRQFDQLILNRIASNFAARGYTRELDPANNAFDVAVLVSATSRDFWNIYSGWGWYGGWGWWGGWGPCCYGPGWGWGYPPSVGASYAYTTGTLIVDMVEPSDDPANEPEMVLPIRWNFSMNGVLSVDTQSSRVRIENGIDQAFVQSPYLK